jgi:hypothetical protein
MDPFFDSLGMTLPNDMGFYNNRPTFFRPLPSRAGAINLTQRREPD